MIIVKRRRVRAIYILAALATIAIGLVVHIYGASLGPSARDILGDALWASMIAWGVGALAPHAKLALRSAAAYAVCAAVEVSQLYHTAALDAIRATRAGQLVLGSGFDPRDLAAYALGVLSAMFLESVILARVRRRSA